MDEMKMDWDDVRLFLAVARGGGLAAAATDTGKSPPTLGRRMLALESQLGCELFNRLPRGYALTAAGEDLFSRAVALESGVAALAAINPGPSSKLVKVSAGQWVTCFLCQHAHSLLDPDAITLRFIADDGVLDISRRETILGIRNRRPTQPALAARRIGRVAFAVYAASPHTDTWARVLGDTPSAQWVASAAKGEPCIDVTNPRNALDLANAGVAKTVLPTFIAQSQPQLQRVGPVIESLSHDQWLVSHNDERFDPAVRRVIEGIVAVLSTANPG